MLALSIAAQNLQLFLLYDTPMPPCTSGHTPILTNFSRDVWHVSAGKPGRAAQLDCTRQHAMLR